MRSVDAAGLSIGDGHPPRVMGVLNVSTESPYDPSVYDDPAAAAAHVDDMVAEGADVVDVGLESANKRFEVLSPDEELERLDVAADVVASASRDPVFSIETRYHEVAEAALDRGFDMVNDVCGFADPEMPRVCADHDVAVVKMASPPDLERPGALDTVEEIYEGLTLNGFTDKTIVDPAFGGWSAAKTTDVDREALRRLREFRAHGRPILVSINRKNFLKEVAGRDTDGALAVSLGATAVAVERGAHVVRTHDVAETRDAALAGAAFARERLRDPDVGVEELDVTTPGEARRHLVAAGARHERAPEMALRVFALEGLDAPPGTVDGVLPPGVTLARGDGDRHLCYGTVGALRSVEPDAAPTAASRKALGRVVEAVEG